MLSFGYISMTVAETIQLRCSLGLIHFVAKWVWLVSLSLPRPSAAKSFLEIQLNLPLLQTAYTVHIIKRLSYTKRSISYNYDQQIFKSKAAYASKTTDSFGNFNFPRKPELFHPLQSVTHAQIKLPLNNLSCLIKVFCNFLGNNPTAIFALLLLSHLAACFFPDTFSFLLPSQLF